MEWGSGGQSFALVKGGEVFGAKRAFGKCLTPVKGIRHFTGSRGVFPSDP